MYFFNVAEVWFVLRLGRSRPTAETCTKLALVYAHAAFWLKILASAPA